MYSRGLPKSKYDEYGRPIKKSFFGQRNNNNNNLTYSFENDSKEENGILGDLERFKEENKNLVEGNQTQRKVDFKNQEKCEEFSEDFSKNLNSNILSFFYKLIKNKFYLILVLLSIFIFPIVLVILFVYFMIISLPKK